MGQGRLFRPHLSPSSSTAQTEPEIASIVRQKCSHFGFAAERWTAVEHFAVAVLATNTSVP